VCIYKHIHINTHAYIYKCIYKKKKTPHNIIGTQSPTQNSLTHSHKLKRRLECVPVRALSLGEISISTQISVSTHLYVWVREWLGHSRTHTYRCQSHIHTTSPYIHIHTYIHHLYVWVGEWLTCMCKLVCDWDEYVWVGVWLRRTLYLSLPPSPRSLTEWDLSLYSDLSLHSSQSLMNSQISVSRWAACVSWCVTDLYVWVGVWLRWVNRDWDLNRDWVIST